MLVQVHVFEEKGNNPPQTTVKNEPEDSRISKDNLSNAGVG